MLLQLLQTHAPAALAAEDWTQCAAILNAATIVQTDPTPVTYSLIRERFGEPVRLLVANTVRAAAQNNGDMADAHQLLLNGGLRLDLDERQQALQVLATAGNWPPEVLANLASLGRRMVSPAGAAGVSAVTAETCAREVLQQSLRDSLTALKQSFDARFNVALENIRLGSITSYQQLVAAVQIGA